MCTWGTPVRARLSCHCSKVIAATIVTAAIVVGLWLWTHVLALLVLAAAVVALGAAAVAGLMWVSNRVTGPMSVLVFQPDQTGVQPVHHHPAPVTASPAPAPAAPARSAPEPAAMDVPDYPPAEWLAQS